jgi:putative NADH-flavin reductase
MKLTIFAATGGIGRLVLEQAVAAGHDVTAVVRNPKKLSSEVRVVRADLASPDPTVLESAVKGADAVISALGAVSASDAGVAWRGTRAIVQAMQATGVRRIIVVSAAPISTVPSPRSSESAETRPWRWLLHATRAQSADQSRAPKALCRSRADGGRPAGQWTGPSCDHHG